MRLATALARYLGVATQTYVDRLQETVDRLAAERDDALRQAAEARTEAAVMRSHPAVSREVRAAQDALTHERDAHARTKAALDTCLVEMETLRCAVVGDVGAEAELIAARAEAEAAWTAHRRAEARCHELIAERDTTRRRNAELLEANGELRATIEALRARLGIEEAA